MTIQLSLWDKTEEVGHLRTALWMINENEMLEHVFPDEEFWNTRSPMAFDFIHNETKARTAIREYVVKKTNSKETGIYIADNLSSRSDVRLATTPDLERGARAFIQEFLRIYKIGIRIQKRSGEARVMITS